MLTRYETLSLADARQWMLSALAQAGKPLCGIQHSHAGQVVAFGGGLPVVMHQVIVGAVGASAGTVEQDMAVAQAAVAALGGLH